MRDFLSILFVLLPGSRQQFFFHSFVTYYLSNDMLHCTSNTRNLWVTKKNESNIFLCFYIYYSTINSFIIKFGSIIYLSALLSTCAICNVCGSANNSNFQFSITNVNLIIEQKNPSKLPFPPEKKENDSFSLTVSFLVNHYNTSSLFFVCLSWSANVYVNIDCSW